MSDKQQPGLSTETNPGYRRGGARAPAKASTGRSLGMNLMVAVLIAGLAAAGWFIAEQMEMLKAEQARVSNANARLEVLEARLVATDSAMSQGGEDTKEQINLWESEIRKLWAVSNERNKTWIKDNERNVAKLLKAIDGIEAANRDMRAAVGRHESAFEQQQALVDKVTSLEMQMQQVARGQRDLVDKVNAATQSVASLRANLASKVDDNSEAIQSIDAFRIAINSRLADIERRLSGVAGPAGR